MDLELKCLTENDLIRLRCKSLLLLLQSFKQPYTSNKTKHFSYMYACTYVCTYLCMHASMIMQYTYTWVLYKFNICATLKCKIYDTYVHTSYVVSIYVRAYVDMHVHTNRKYDLVIHYIHMYLHMLCTSIHTFSSCSTNSHSHHYTHISITVRMNSTSDNDGMFCYVVIRSDQCSHSLSYWWSHWNNICMHIYNTYCLYVHI